MVIVIILAGLWVFALRGGDTAPDDVTDDDTGSMNDGTLTNSGRGISTPTNGGSTSNTTNTSNTSTNTADPDVKIYKNLAVVNYTEGGFEPNTVIIEQGDAVRFINKSSRAMTRSSPRTTAVE